jgi:large exoprotein involved in heme utilization and adhesion
VQDGAGIAVDSQGTGQGGDIEIQSNFVTLDNQAFISAKTASNTGGDINLRVQDLLLLRRESGISTTAGTAQAGGDGGDITIGAQFIVGVPSENSDITANAFQGRGGNINITTQGIFGLEYRPRLTPVSDINASSEFGIDGSVQINTPGIDPSRGLTQLPTDLVDAAGLVDRSCTSGGGVAQRSRFTVTGRGGLPPNPVEALNSDTVWTDLRPLIESTEKTSRSTVGTQPNQDAVTSYSSGLIHPDSPPTQIVEAQGWIIARDGTVILTAQVPTVTPQSPWQTSLFCQSQT